MELTLSRPLIRKLAVITLILFAGAALAYIGYRALAPLFADAPSAANAPDAAAAVEGVSAFYTLSSTEGIEGWTGRVCAVSTEAGCTLTKSFLAASMNALLQKGVETTASAQPIKPVDGDETIRIWELTVTLDQPWAGFENPQTVYATVRSGGRPR